MKGERHVGGEIRVLSNLIKRCMDDGMPPETTGMQGWIIGFLHRNEDRDMFQRDVEAEFNIRRSTATGILQLMEKNGFLLREPVAYDARLKKLVLTPRYYLTVFLRLILYPMMTLGLLWLLKAQTWIPDGKAILMTVFLSGITPVCSALNSMVQLYDRDMEESGALYVLTTLLSIVTMPLVIAVFERVM